MADTNVRELGRVEDIDGASVPVGVDYDSVTIGYPQGVSGWRLNREQAEEFAQLFVRACWEAARCGTEQELEARG